MNRVPAGRVTALRISIHPRQKTNAFVCSHFARAHEGKRNMSPTMQQHRISEGHVLFSLRCDSNPPKSLHSCEFTQFTFAVTQLSQLPAPVAVINNGCFFNPSADPLPFRASPAQSLAHHSSRSGILAHRRLFPDTYVRDQTLEHLHLTCTNAICIRRNCTFGSGNPLAHRLPKCFFSPQRIACYLLLPVVGTNEPALWLSHPPARI